MLARLNSPLFDDLFRGANKPGDFPIAEQQLPLSPRLSLVPQMEASPNPAEPIGAIP